MDPPSSTVSFSGTEGDGHAETDLRLRPPPTSENRFSTSPQLFVRSSDVLSKGGPKPPARRRTRHKVLDTRLSTGDATDGANPPAPGDSLQRLSALSDGFRNEEGAKPYDVQQAGTTGEEAVGVRDAVKNEAVVIVVQEPEAVAKAVHPILTTKPGPNRDVTHGPSSAESDQAVNVHPVTADSQPAMAEEAVSVEPQEYQQQRPVKMEQLSVVVTPPCSLEEDQVMPPGEIVNQEQQSAGEALNGGEEETAQSGVYLMESSSDSDSDVELVTAGYLADRYEQNSPQDDKEEGHMYEQSCSEHEQQLKEDYQPGEEAPKNDQPENDTPKNDLPGEETPKNDLPGEEIPKNDLPGEEAPKNGEPEEEVPKNDQPGEEAPKNGEPEEEVPKNDQPEEETPKNDQPGEETPKNDQPGDKATVPTFETPSHTAGTLNLAGPPPSNSPSTHISKPKRPPPPPKPPKPAVAPVEATPAVTKGGGAQSNSPVLPRCAEVSNSSSPSLILHPIEGGRLSQKKKVPPPIVPMPYTPKTALPPLPPKKVRPAPPPRAHNTHLSGNQSSSLTTMPGRELSPTPPTSTTQGVSLARPIVVERDAINGPPPGSSPSDVEDRFKHRARVPSPPRGEDDASPVDEVPVQLMSKPEYIHHHDNRSSTASSVASPLSTSPSPSTLSKVGRRLSIGLMKELATQEALAGYEIISDSSEGGEASHSVEEEDIYAIVKACNTANPKKLLVSELPPKLDGFPSDKRSLVIHELYTTEHTYVSRLEVLIEVFKEPLSKILGDETGCIFGNVDDICAFNKRFLALLYDRLSDWSDEKSIGDIFLGMFTQAHKSMYAIYCSNYDSAEVLLNQKMKRKDFELQLQQCLTHPRLVPGLSLAAYIILPVQRIPRYILLLKDIIKYTPEDHKGYKQLVTSMEKMKELANYIDSQVKDSQTKRSLESLKNKVQGLADLDSTERVFVKDGQVYLKNIKRLYQCILFSDLLVFAVGDNKQSAVDLALRLEAVWVEDLEDRDPQTSMEDAIEIYNPERPYTIYACSKNEKKLWLAKLKETIYADLLKSSKCVKREDMSSESRIARFVYNDGRVYSGDFQDAQCHGKGIMNWPNKSVYSGEWRDNERCGEGEFTFNTGDVYQGGWVEDKQTGFGEMRYASNDVYKGWWRDGLQHGNGKIIYANGDVFEGHFENGQIEGKGHLKCINGQDYDGDWKSSQREGQGVLRTVSGNVYTGAFKHDRMHGKGIMVYVTGDRYEGSWKNGMRSGNGVLKTAQNQVYEGSWDRDMKHGAGKELYPNGDTYEGTFELNRRKGKGVLRYKTGEVYSGEFHNDLFHGEGEMRYWGISKYEGSWTNGQRHGHGVMVYSDGSSYSGTWEAGLRSGVGELVCCDGFNYKGQWLLDKPNGRGQLKNPNASYFYDGDWENGMREGRGTEQSPYGQYIGNWKNDLKHGRGQEKAAIGTYFDGTWERGRKSGRGTRKMVFGTIEEQVWKSGQLQNNQSRMTAAELPYVPRYDY